MLAKTTTTLTEAAAKVTSLLSDKTDNFYTSEEVIGWLGDAFVELTGALPARFMPGLYDLQNVTSVEGQNQVSLADVSPPIYRVLNVLVQEPEGGAQGYLAQPSVGRGMRTEEVNRARTSSDWAPTARPMRWVVRGTSLTMYCYADDASVPMPAKSVGVEYIKQIVWPPDASTPLPLSSDAVVWLVFAAARFGFLKGGNLEAAAYCRKEYDAGIKQAFTIVAQEGLGE